MWVALRPSCTLHSARWDCLRPTVEAMNRLARLQLVNCQMLRLLQVVDRLLLLLLILMLLQVVDRLRRVRVQLAVVGVLRSVGSRL